LWRDELGTRPPYSLGPETLSVAYAAHAEIGFYLAVGWSKPARILDLYVEYRNRYNCLPTIVDQKVYQKDEEKPKRNSLMGAMIQFGLDTIGVSKKKKMIDLINTGGPWTPADKREILDYCESDVDGLDRLLSAMLRDIDVPRALYRGRYTASVASMERVGIPIDVELLTRLRSRWGQIEQELITRVDAQYRVYEGTAFRRNRFERWLAARGILWPRYPNGGLILHDDVFGDMAKIHPELRALRELRRSLSQLRLHELPVGRDGRNRCGLFPFATRSSRNSPSNTQFIFGPGVWVRGLIKPPPGFGLAYIDWVSQEFGVAAALSGDPAMKTAYESGDVYLGFAKAAKAVPPDGTRQTHKLERDLYKQCALAVSYGMKEHSLALRIDRHLLIARGLLRHHHEIFWRFWQWSDNRVRRTMFDGVTYTVFGWKYHVALNPNVRSIGNFPMQANAAEIMRLAICLGVENGITVCAPIHDAILIMAPLDRLDEDVVRMRGFMEEASQVVLNGFKLRTRIRHGALSGSLHGRARSAILECGHVTFMNSNLETLNLRPDQLEALKNGGSLQMWDDIPMVIEKPQVSDHQNRKKYKWTQYDYREQLELAKLTRNALLAVLAELHRLHFIAWGKKAPIRFGTSVLRSLGFSRHDKIRALRTLEKAGWITVQWHKCKSPDVTRVPTGRLSQLSWTISVLSSPRKCTSATSSSTARNSTTRSDRESGLRNRHSSPTRNGGPVGCGGGGACGG
jgi:hypothetical protein